MYELIKELCVAKGISPTKLCTEITGSKGNLPTWQKGNINPKSLIKIADYFDVSVDYLLGRTDNPDCSPNGNSIKTGDITGDNNANMSINSKKFSKETIELVEMIEDLSLVERAKIVLFIDEMKNKEA